MVYTQITFRIYKLTHFVIPMESQVDNEDKDLGFLVECLTYLGEDQMNERIKKLEKQMDYVFLAIALMLLIQGIDLYI